MLSPARRGPEARKRPMGISSTKSPPGSKTMVLKSPCHRHPEGPSPDIRPPRETAGPEAPRMLRLQPGKPRGRRGTWRTPRPLPTVHGPGGEFCRGRSPQPHGEDVGGSDGAPSSSPLGNREWLSQQERDTKKNQLQEREGSAAFSPFPLGRFFFKIKIIKLIFFSSNSNHLPPADTHAAPRFLKGTST